ncbi:serine/threonine protein phosphatase, putative [Eimeria necatrix]|uniref:Serine/threonine protein phosphatase, putative n=1 Tax=Eimeria necatrix TaxID=51315 RepID=U6MVJ2_9EIME|nr:serine/threonine protein phosphatase, putative [Eimeria necatrix]CDJ66499.1 serine/threonine protein phosphatase, putative [Eimeria necatrix]
MLVKVQSTSLTLPGAEDQLTWSGPFTFALIADPQFGLYRNNNSWEEERQQVAECILAAASLSSKPAFIAILGDLVHAPVPALSHESLQDEVRADQQAKDLKDVIDKPSKDVPVLVLPGNHDVGNAPTAASIADYEQLWGKDHFSFWFGGVKFVAANSSVLYDDTNAKELAEASNG